MTVEFSRLLGLVEERGVAFREAVASAPGLDVPVPTCPGWTLRDLVVHLGTGQRRWAAIVAAGPADVRPAETGSDDAVAGLREREELLGWFAESTERLVSVLREAGPDRGCWAGWARSQSPRNSGAVARHRLQEVAVHTYDAQVAVGEPRPLPDEVALDGVEEFQLTCCATTAAWPHEPAVVDYHAVEGRSWRLRLSGDGARVDRLAEPGTSPATASARGTASDLVLVFYGRVPLDSLELDGDRRVFDRLIAWEPDA